MRQQEKDEEELPIFKITSMQRLEDQKKRRGRRITATKNNRDNTSINWPKITRKQKWEKNMDILNDEQAKSIARKLPYG